MLKGILIIGLLIFLLPFMIKVVIGIGILTGG